MDLRLLEYFVAVAEERSIGRAADRLAMTQPPLSRAVQRLERELGVRLLERTNAGVTVTPAGEVLLREAIAVLDRVDLLRRRVAHDDPRRIAVGTLADAADLVGARLVAAYREQRPDVTVEVHEADLSDPTAGLRSGLVDAAITRTPFDDDGLQLRELARQEVGLVVRAEDPLAREEVVRVADLVDRRWVRLPEGTDQRWLDYWTGPGGAPPDVPPVRTISECVQGVLWNQMTALAPLDQVLPPGLVTVPVTDREPNLIVLAWRADDPHPLVRALVETADRVLGRPGRTG
ncbi:LysR family transcriptional regulator [Marmoricola endophyticus]|uniref:LysR family transcriptional regulator n=1 Tax=Marmoricola endophyticus TaxID=2040280 RepID=A0A917BMU8_9ACTN|nr:LysR family transcriptional regulator [Marmoricola endophyticus]GGF49910.1 LysR family transcriptional regulator [Marmoricola endophyticus]